MMRSFIFISMTSLLVACASPEPDYYTLSQIDGSVLNGPPLLVKIQRPALPAYLDRPEMSRQSGYKIDRDDKRLWAEPLDTMISRVIAQNLSQRLQGSNIYAEAANIAMNAPCSINIDIQQFDPDTDGHSVISAHVAFYDSAHVTAISLKPVALLGDSASTGASMANSMSLLIGQLSDRIAEELNRAENNGCSATRR